MTGAGRQFAGWIGAAALLASVTARAQPAPARMDEALRQLGAIETRMDGLLRDQLAQQQQLDAASRQLEEQRGQLGNREEQGAAARAFLESYDADRRQRMETLSASIAQQQTAAREARARREQTAAMLAAAVQSDAPPAALLPAALLDRHWREQARLATHRALRLEADRGELAGERAHAGESGRYFSAFESLSLEQLRARQAVLVEEVAVLREQIGTQETTMEQLESQRKELRELVRVLIAESADHPPVVLPQPTPKAQATIPAAVGAEAEAEMTESGTRVSFWHATPVTVRALAGGRIVYAGKFAGYRNLVIIDQGDGWHTLLGNLTRNDVKVGDGIVAGQPVGQYQAAEGNRAEPLWFEVRRGTDPVAPDQWPGLPEDWRQRLLTQGP